MLLAARMPEAFRLAWMRVVPRDNASEWFGRDGDVADQRRNLTRGSFPEANNCRLSANDLPDQHHAPDPAFARVGFLKGSKAGRAGAACHLQCRGRGGWGATLRMRVILPDSAKEMLGIWSRPRARSSGCGPLAS